VGQVSSTKSVRIMNPGTQPLNVSKITSSANVSAAADCAIVQPGGDCHLSVSLAALSAGPATGTVTVFDDAADSPQTFTVRGTGVYGGDVELVSFTAGSPSVSSGTATLPITAVVRNNGPHDAETVTLRVSNNVGGSDCSPCQLGTLKT